MNEDQNQQRQGFMADCERIHREWHERAKGLDTDGLLRLYAEDAVLESPLVPAILDDKPDGVLHGHAELRRFFEEGARRRPNDVVRWYRTGKWLTDGRRLLVWEYPRQAPDGDQVDLVGHGDRDRTDPSSPHLLGLEGLHVDCARAFAAYNPLSRTALLSRKRTGIDGSDRKRPVSPDSGVRRRRA